MSNARGQLNYSSNLFFKYTLPREGEDSVYARNIIIEHVTGIGVKESTVLNLNLDPDIIKKERIILDVHVKDEQNRHFNIEMQTTCKRVAEVMRFELYDTRALSNQLKSGESCNQLRPIYQVVFINEYAWNNKNLINQYQMRNEQGEDENGYPLILRTFVRMPTTNDIVKKKEMQRLNDFEQLMYLFENDEKNDILKSKERLMRVSMNGYEGVQKGDKLWSTATVIQMGEARYRSGLRDSFDKGKAAGKMEGGRQLLHRQMQIKFHEDCATWLQALAEEQMRIVSTLLLRCDTFKSLRKRLHKSDKK